MPLSEQEQRLLDEMERQLLRHDADVVSASAGGTALSYRNLVVGALGVLLGLGLIVGGIAVWNSLLALGVTLGVVGFVLMVVGVIFAITPTKNGTAQLPRVQPNGSKPSSSSAPSSSASFMDRMNDRWDKRQRGE